jgi:hypothetical protein
MSTYPSTARPALYEQAPPPSERPTTLTGAVGAAVGVAVLNLISAIAMLAAGSDLVREQIAKNSGSGSSVVDPSTVDLTSERAEGLSAIYTALASAMIFWALVLGVLAYFALRGGRTTRVLASIILFVTAGLKAADPIVAMPGLAFVADLLIGVLAPVAIVMFFLPASNKYGKLRRTRTAGH